MGSGLPMGSQWGQKVSMGSPWGALWGLTGQQQVPEAVPRGGGHDEAPPPHALHMGVPMGLRDPYGVPMGSEGPYGVRGSLCGQGVPIGSL